MLSGNSRITPVWVIISGILTALSIPNRLVHIPGLALIALVPLFLLAERPGLWRRCLGVWLIAGLWAFIPDVWTVRSLLEVWEILGGLVVAPLVPLYLVIITALSLKLSAKLPYRPIAIALIWTAWDGVWGLLHLPLPLYFGLNLYDLPLLVQIADLTGIYGVTFTAILVNATLAQLIAERRHLVKLQTVKLQSSVLIPLALLGLIVAYDLTRSLPASGANYTVAAVQPLNWLTSDRSWENRRINYSRLHTLSQGAIAAGANLVVWPEGAARAQLTQFGLEDFVVGPVTERLEPEGGLITGSSEILNETQFINAALLYDATGTLRDRYGKQWVFPIFETGRGIAPDTAGHKPLIGSDRLGAMGTMICLESVLPQASRALTQAGAESLLVISEDIWFGNSNWPLFHGVMSVFRAVENRRSFVFVNNTGGNMIVDAHGDIVAWGDYWYSDAVLGRVERRSELSFYTRYGDCFAIACVAATGGLLGWRRYRRR